METIELGTLAKIKGGKRLPKGHDYSEDPTPFPYLRVVDFKRYSIDNTNLKYLREVTRNSIERYTISKDDLYISIAGTIGRVGTIPDTLDGANLTENAAKITEIEGFDKYFLSYYLNSLIAQNQIADRTKATTQPKLALYRIEKIRVPVISLPEQHRIVAKIEELFNELDKGVESLKQTQAQLKTYRQAVLKAAFEGKLTDDVKEGMLPKGWNWIKLEDITSLLGDGLHGTPIYSEGGDYFFINGNNLSNGKIKIKENTKQVSRGEYEKYKKPLNENTVFVSINGTLGNTAFYNGEKVILGKSACYFNILPLVDKYYIRYCITSQRFLNYAFEKATGSTIKNVSLRAMRAFEVPIPPTIKEQNAVVSIIESRLSVCDNLEKSIEDGLKQAESLRQSILKRAFEGRLV